MQWLVVSTLLPRDEETAVPNGWIRGNTKIGPVLEVTTCCLQDTYGVEIRIMSISKDDSQSWVRISHGFSKLVTNLNNNEQGEYSISDYDVSKKLIHLLRHASLPRGNDGAIEFWRTGDNFQDHFLYCHHWSDNKWKKSMARGGGNKKRYLYCTGSSGAILYFRALQGHSGRSLIRTMSSFRAASSISFIMSDVQSIYIPSSIRD